MPITDTALAAVMYAPGATIPDNLKKVAAILYGSGDVIPDHLLKIALMDRGATMATGQTTQYSSYNDDGLYQKGVAKRYTVLTTGQYSGTTTIDQRALQRGDIAFTAATKTISAAAGLGTILTGDTIVIVAGGGANAGAVLTVAAGGSATAIVVNEAISDVAAGSVTIAKRELHSNACVLDLNTGLMWSRTCSDKVGDGSDGKLEWLRDNSVSLDAFTYVTNAGTASLAGYTDWRIANKKEMESLINDENNPSGPDTTAFPSLPATPAIWTSTTSKKTTTSAWAYLGANEGEITPQAKTTDSYVLLVRGG